MTAHKKHRKHDLKDAAHVETRYIEKPFSAVTKIVPAQKKSKKNHPKPEMHASTRAHEYEYSPSIDRSKGVGAKLQRAIPRKIARQQQKSHYL